MWFSAWGVWLLGFTSLGARFAAFGLVYKAQDAVFCVYVLQKSS